jgi:hypothetical protein
MAHDRLKPYSNTPLRYFLNAVGERAQDRFSFTPAAAESLMPLFAAW